MTTLNFEKFRAIVARMDSPHDGERLAALSLASKALQAAGLRWDDVLREPAPEAKPADNPWDGMFDDFARSVELAKARKAKAAEAARPVRHVYVTGGEIPATVSGRIVVTDERTTRTGTMLVVSIGDANTTYGPLNVFDAALIRTIRQNQGAIHAARIRQPGDPAKGWPPTIRSLA